MATWQLRDALELALIHQPDTVTTDFLDKLLEVPFQDRYRRLDLQTLLPGGEQSPALRSVINALNILEKYGKNLLSLHRPKFWRIVKFNNPVFKSTVDAINGGRHVLSLYGYTQSLPDGLSFPDAMQEPDTAKVAAVTADVIILHRELNLLISNSHPYQERAAQELLMMRFNQSSLVADSVAFSRPVPSVSESSSEGCGLCGVKTVSVVCTMCNDMLCLKCDHRVHSHPNRSHHQRTPFDASPSHRPKDDEFLSHVSSRPPWQCMSCHTLNRGGAVLCVGCDRPRGCNNALSMPLEAGLLKDTWECQACTLQNPSSAVLCAVCDRPRLAGKPSRDGQESTAPVYSDIKDTKDLYKKHAPLNQSRFMSLSEKSKTTVFGSMYDKPANIESSNPKLLTQGNNDASLPYLKKSSPESSYVIDKSINELNSSLEHFSEPQYGEAEDRIKMSKAWQCSHCTYYNMCSGRVCEMCDRTSEGLTPTEEIRKKEEERQSKYQDEMRQKQLKEEGAKMVALIKEGEAHGVSPEEVCSAIRYSGTEKPLWWLQSELVYVLERLIDAASLKAGSELGAFTTDEARSVWLSCGGDMEEAVNLCIIQRRNKVEELCSLGFQDRDKVVAALYESGGSVPRALSILQAPLLEPFLRRVWEDKDVPFQLDSRDRQALLRRLLAEYALHSWGRAELALSLLQEGEGRYNLQDVVEAVRESQDRDFIKRMLTQECAVCGLQLPRNKMRSLTSCECCICPECFWMHFTVAVKEKHIRDMVCPACEEPEISDEGELLHYFSTLDILLRDTLEEDAYNLFHKKLTERTLMKDPKFLWCTHCSFGFIYERDQLDVKCPQCKCRFCRKCKRPWEEQHQALSCEDFQCWKRENDAEYQAQGLAVYLQENGITCPHCKFSYALARGGCMHFICSQCRHQFCSGCYNTFHSKNKCTVPTCTVRMSLHAHHPRNCLFYLRDWEVSRLQTLLQMSNVAFNTDPPAGTQAGPGGGCRVMEQKENIDGLRDEACGKQTAFGYAGLCESHYKEYLVSRINALSLDPCILYDLEETVTVCKRYLQKCPTRETTEDENIYKDRLVKMLMLEMPLSPVVQRNHHP
ncbi:E3 ubiquitin-protein ligase RNF31 [Hyla sarda]|uniref:E3 ubiquitin-protein ligase RNF31 n=1 Tax=Hyla sarda TaxID=327740 RepID=UPI0024C2781E|nr:E3 ubiquitin-protein ligase RNF31 [Hyla sarda]XP_056381853.1 E3 ubiquitin-protein ligase RNF31 [Hyla sarda]XP_056381860.1 E3 ubiquitin-protein ligase RNF31 [Hyla sarda]XP_056381871.1 E3 ubiquitin-protein ligase RNF31 [Hyla sarda]XP_056381882.1 E3 ubiquitin-protein ligase RNF31 [Hyla sarda]